MVWVAMKCRSAMVCRACRFWGVTKWHRRHCHKCHTESVTFCPLLCIAPIFLCVVYWASVLFAEWLLPALWRCLCTSPRGVLGFLGMCMVICSWLCQWWFNCIVWPACMLIPNLNHWEGWCWEAGLVFLPVWLLPASPDLCCVHVQLRLRTSLLIFVFHSECCS